jgi:hypothetical protein
MRLRYWLAFACVVVTIGRAVAEPAAATREGPSPRREGPSPREVAFSSEGASPSEAVPEPAPIPAPKAQISAAENSLCLMIESAARAHDLPVDFRSDAVGPRTRSGQRAQGIAQFMPGTAAERGLLDPFDPTQALPKSAEFLKELRERFGNLGLAAAAYNAGPQRVRDWLAGIGTMPQETRNYVVAITGRSVEDWSAARGKRMVPEPRPASGCGGLIALVKSAPNPFVRELEQRVALGAAKVWGVQLAAGFSKDDILVVYGRAMSRLGEVLQGRDPSILAALLRNRGTRPFYQVRVGADTRAEADALCGRIRKAGGSCLVLRNQEGGG